MNWYLAKIVFRIVCGAGNHQPQFDEQLRLIAADTLQEALTKARALGEEEQDRFLNHQQQWVHWQFVNVAELTDLDWKDGARLHETITEPTFSEGYVRLINEKAAKIYVCASSQGDKMHA
jgi:hypothetical protein